MGSHDERILLIWLTTTIVVTSTLGLTIGIADHLFVGVGIWLGPAVFVAATFLGLSYDVVRYRTFRFECTPDTLYLEGGVLTQVRTIVPVASVHRVDIRRGPVERLVGLQRLVVYTAGPPSATLTIPGLSTERAHTLADQLHTNCPSRKIAAEV